MAISEVSKQSAIVLLLPFALGACATSGSYSTPSIEARPATGQTLVISESTDRMHLEGIGEVAISSSYFSASGKTCRLLTTIDGRALLQRICEAEKGGWYVTRNISSPDPLAPSSQLLESTKVVVESVSMTLNPGETLWAFSSRVTGNALNWKKIAAFNNIEDADSVWGNQAIEVDSSLLLEGL